MPPVEAAQLAAFSYGSPSWWTESLKQFFPAFSASYVAERERACLGVSWMIFTLPDRDPPLSLHLTLITSLVHVHNGGWDFHKELGGYAVQSTAMTKCLFSSNVYLCQWHPDESGGKNAGVLLINCYRYHPGYLRSTWNASLISLKLEVWAHIRSLL